MIGGVEKTSKINFFCACLSFVNGAPIYSRNTGGGWLKARSTKMKIISNNFSRNMTNKYFQIGKRKINKSFCQEEMVHFNTSQF